MSEFKKGDIVRLKSGGPSMTVERISDSSMVENPVKCQWFAGHKLQEGWFAPESIELVEESEETQ
jgi:uncharacterized protein YodC (DUF2158 family)